jgi:hypothetical protein
MNWHLLDPIALVVLVLASAVYTVLKWKGKL